MRKANGKQKRLLMNPWITTKLLILFPEAEHLCKTHLKNGDTSKIAFYKNFSNDLTPRKEKSKKQFSVSELNKHKCNPKKLWETMCLILPVNKQQSRFS